MEYIRYKGRVNMLLGFVSVTKTPLSLKRIIINVSLKFHANKPNNLIEFTTF